MSNHPLKFLAIAFAAASLSGCVALRSVKNSAPDEPNAPHGIGYYLPNGNIKLTLTVSEAGGEITRSFSAATVYYPDISNRYSIQLRKNLTANTEMNIAVSSAGLLNSASYTYEPKIIQAIENLAPKKADKDVRGDGGDDPNEEPPCAEPGAYSKMFEPLTGSQGEQFCGYQVTITSLVGTKAAVNSDAKENAGNNPSSDPGASTSAEGTRGNGIFFRMNRPYLIEVGKKGKNGKVLEPVFSDIVLSPTGSSTQFLKLNRALFATSDGAITFSNGVLTGYAPNMDSEIESGFKLPATILKAYFDSVSALFTFRKGRIDGEANYLAAIENFKRTQASLEACEAAYATGDKVKIDANCRKASGQD